MTNPIRVSLVVLLIAVLSCSTARPLGRENYSTSGTNDGSSFARRTEADDLSSTGNSPVGTSDGKKLMKNSAGKSDKGGIYKTYGSDAEGEKGYLKRTYSKGDHGYKTLDTFHKKDGDNYGFEEHTAFGKARGTDKGGKAANGGSYSTKGNDAGDHEGAGTVVDTHYVGDGGDAGAASSSGESVSYSEGGDGEYYGSDGDSGHYGEGDSDGGNYGNSDGYSESYSNEGGDDGTYGSSSSYSSDGEGGGGDYY